MKRQAARISQRSNLTTLRKRRAHAEAKFFSSISQCKAHRRACLHVRVKEILSETQDVVEISAESMATVVERIDELFEIDPSGTRHLFWEEMMATVFCYAGDSARLVEPENFTLKFSFQGEKKTSP